MQPPWRTASSLLKKRFKKLPYDPEVLLPDLYPKEMKSVSQISVPRRSLPYYPQQPRRGYNLKVRRQMNG